MGKKKKNMKLPAQMRIIDLRADFPGFEECFATLKEKKVEFALYFDSIKDTTSHCAATSLADTSQGTHLARLKLFDALDKVLTQHVTLEKAREVVEQGKNVTLDNILLKTNNKTGGLTFAPIIEPAA